MIHVYDDIADLSRAVAETFAETAVESIRARGRFSVLLAGGDTPRQAYQILAREPFCSRIAWEYVHVFWGDERCVPSNDQRNNALSARRALLDHLPLRPEQVHPVQTELPSLQSAEDYESLLRHFFAGGAPAFDLVILGLGEDGHTASLFPGTDRYPEDCWVVVTKKEGEDIDRISLTPLIINQAHKALFLVSGANKSSVLKSVLHGIYNPCLLPAQLIDLPDDKLEWFVDKAAYGAIAELSSTNSHVHAQRLDTMTDLPAETNYREMLERRTHELDVMMDIGKTLTSCLDTGTVLEELMSKVAQLLKPEAWSLLLADDETGELYFEIAVSEVSEQLKGIRLKKGEGVAGYVAESGEPLLIADVSKDDRFALHVDEAVSFETRSIVCVPLKIRNRVLGVIELINSIDQVHFNDADLRITRAIADYAAIAIENARNFKTMNELIITDDLTGLFNANHFHKLLDYEIDRARRYRSEFSMVFLDLDRFKGVNDRYGHLVGSRILAEFGKTIKKHVRSTDFCARYGGDEFVIILPNTSKNGAYSMVMNLRAAIAATVYMSDTNERIPVTASYGISTFPVDAMTKVDMIKAADSAMYEVKEASRDGVKAYR